LDILLKLVNDRDKQHKKGNINQKRFGDQRSQTLYSEEKGGQVMPTLDVWSKAIGYFRK